MTKQAKTAIPHARVRLGDDEFTLHEAADRVAEEEEGPHAYELVEAGTGTSLLQATITDDTGLLDHIEDRLKRLRKAVRTDKRLDKAQRKERIARLDHIETVLGTTWKAEKAELKVRAKEARVAERKARREGRTPSPGAAGGRPWPLITTFFLATAVVGGGVLYTMQGNASPTPGVAEAETLEALEARVDLTTALLLGDARTIDKLIETGNLRDEDRRLLVPYLVETGRIDDAVAMSDGDHQLVADQISKTGDWATLETFQDEYPTANGQFDLAYRAKDWETALSTRGITESPERLKRRQAAERALDGANPKEKKGVTKETQETKEGAKK
ncbi:hypothetical protein EXIGUO8A_430004 [Exiguobacterium sp. 8A]|uniref:hypothetical protein n=1 Tax=Exiguobacterium sp. 8A TaxID=2653139 RepID=UPI0012F3323A|nr:hypothetical protein [Exiguobacterium sp. 8A]VXB97964.1 hypothetical protein EXIGUO8A_430004 [Exiguobacterium sp. 8A]